MTLGKLHAKLIQKVDFNDPSFWAAANKRDLMSTPERCIASEKRQNNDLPQ
ncbi:MAG TPA: hypothetical protein PLE99_11245 [Candidatus Thiothrix moscowensis]|uniref:hypothetical protein n=1 Tax=unclassified Thiothrix TaxID=2636184 RepID=UPI001A2E2A16|nr:MULTISPECIES: hypothetical protein [unclassified Thiothrix]MBJ6608999.1 hypothetical protein [Candidatus Thiothrix moscowensis]HRJ53335.1 hypothetical protein [Candidatus Thiothrix moscowensis]HRJ94174.1 hypothetical protein [Candidatus Thiothrix moscowensis]